MPVRYNFFGDIHGFSREFKQAVARANEDTSVPSLNISCGDLVDRGPNQLATVDYAQNHMDEVGLGNHELNALALFTQVNGKYIREHTEHNVKQHQDFIDEVNWGSAKHREILAWFKQRPVFLELEGVNLIHACWHKESLAIVRPHLNENNALGDDGLERYATNKEFKDALETLLMGPEYPLPDGVTFIDAHGKERDRARIFWASSKERLSERLDLRGAVLTEEQKLAIDETSKGRQFGASSGLTIIGHYSLAGEPTIPQKGNTTICLDFKKTAVTCYQFNKDDTEFHADQLQATPYLSESGFTIA